MDWLDACRLPFGALPPSFDKYVRSHTAIPANVACFSGRFLFPFSFLFTAVCCCNLRTTYVYTFFLEFHLSQMFWAEDPLGEYAPSSEDYTNINTQFVSLFFLNVDDGVEVGAFSLRYLRGSKEDAYWRHGFSRRHACVGFPVKEAMLCSHHPFGKKKR